MKPKETSSLFFSLIGKLPKEIYAPENIDWYLENPQKTQKKPIWREDMKSEHAEKMNSFPLSEHSWERFQARWIPLAHGCQFLRASARLDRAALRRTGGTHLHDPRFGMLALVSGAWESRFNLPRSNCRVVSEVDVPGCRWMVFSPETLNPSKIAGKSSACAAQNFWGWLKKDSWTENWFGDWVSVVGGANGWPALDFLSLKIAIRCRTVGSSSPSKLLSSRASIILCSVLRLNWGAIILSSLIWM